MNLGKLEHRLGGVDLYFDLRLLPEHSLPGDPYPIEKKIQDGIRAIAIKHPQMNIQVQKVSTSPGLDMKEENPLVESCKQAMEAAQIPVVLDRKSTSTEAAQYFQAGYDAVVFGPGLSHGQ